MISEQAKNSLDRIFIRAASANLALSPTDTVEIEPLAPAQVAKTPQILVLTVASYVFRLLTVFHFNDGGAARDYFARSSAGRDLGEIIGELGNLCCGAMNRELGQHFVHTGMSTPTLLSGACFPFLKELKPAYQTQHRIAINAQPVIDATLCLCAYAPIDFRADAQIEAVTTGELELF